MVDIGLGTHHAHRRQAEFGIFARESGSQTAQRTQGVKHRHRDRPSWRRDTGLIRGDPHHFLQRHHAFGDEVPFAVAPAFGRQDQRPRSIVDTHRLQPDAAHRERQPAEHRARDEGAVWVRPQSPPP